MGFPWGRHDNRYITYYRDAYKDQHGNQIWDNQIPVEVWSESTLRTGQSTNRRRPLDGTSTLWIPPSSYITGKTQYRFGRQTLFIEEPGWGHMDWDGPGAWEGVYGWYSKCFEGLASNNIRLDNNAHARAITECMQKIADHKADFGTNLAEAKKTFSMVASAAKDLFGAVLAAKRRDWRGVADHLGGSHSNSRTRDLAKRWLEYAYGWKPLMADIYGGWELLNEQLKPALLLHARRNLNANEALMSSGQLEQARTIQTMNETCDTYMVKCHMTAQIADGYKLMAARAGLINPLNVAWELTPWSFVIDWCVPVGNLLQGLDTWAGLSFTGGHISHFMKTHSEFTETPKPPWRGQGATGSATKFGYWRGIFVNPPLPMPYYKSPFSTAHSLNALALLRQIVR